MCSKVQCRKCGKATWSGCGEHIEYALQGVAEKDRCTCQESNIDQAAEFMRIRLCLPKSREVEVKEFLTNQPRAEERDLSTIWWDK